MQIQISSDAIKRQAKILIEFLKGEGLELKHSRGLEAVSRMYLFRDWRTANGSLPAGEAQVSREEPKDRVPAHMPDLEPAFLKIVDRRLAEAVKPIDDRTHHELRRAFDGVNPSHNSKRWSAILDELQMSVHQGLQARAAAIREVLQNLKREHRLVGDRLVQHVMHYVTKHFPEGLYFHVVKEIAPEAFQRDVNRKMNESEARQHNLKCGLIEVGSLNGRAQSLREIQTDLLEWQFSSKRADRDGRLIRVVYSTEAFARGGQSEPAQQSERDFISPEDARKAPLPDGATFAMFKLDGETHVYDRKFGWTSHRGDAN